MAYIGFTVIALSLYGIFKNRKIQRRGWRSQLFGWLTHGLTSRLPAPSHRYPGCITFTTWYPCLTLSGSQQVDLIFTMTLAILSALGAKALIEKLSKSGTKRMALYVTVALSLLILIEVNGMPLGSSAIAVSGVGNDRVAVGLEAGAHRVVEVASRRAGGSGDAVPPGQTCRRRSP